MELKDGLPPSVIEIIGYLALMARGYDNHLRWNEQDRFKADLMRETARWRIVEPKAFRRRCLREGMRQEDVNELVGWLVKRKAGRRLVPSRTYRDASFKSPSAEELALGFPPLHTSRDW